MFGVNDLQPIPASGGGKSALQMMKCAVTDTKLMLSSVLLYQSLGMPKKGIVIPS